MNNFLAFQKLGIKNLFCLIKLSDAYKARVGKILEARAADIGKNNNSLSRNGLLFISNGQNDDMDKFVNRNPQNYVHGHWTVNGQCLKK